MKFSFIVDHCFYAGRGGGGVCVCVWVGGWWGGFIIVDTCIISLKWRERGDRNVKFKEQASKPQNL